MKINELNKQIKDQELKILDDEILILKAKEDRALMLLEETNGLEKTYKASKNVEYSTIAKREAIVNGYEHNKTLKEQIDNHEYQLKKDKIELSFMKREFNIRVKEEN